MTRPEYLALRERLKALARRMRRKAKAKDEERRRAIRAQIRLPLQEGLYRTLMSLAERVVYGYYGEGRRASLVEVREDLDRTLDQLAAGERDGMCREPDLA